MIFLKQSTRPQRHWPSRRIFHSLMNFKTKKKNTSNESTMQQNQVNKLSRLPSELLESILNHVGTYADVVNVSLSCKSLHNATSECCVDTIELHSLSTQSFPIVCKIKHLKLMCATVSDITELCMPHRDIMSGLTLSDSRQVKTIPLLYNLKTLTISKCSGLRKTIDTTLTNLPRLESLCLDYMEKHSIMRFMLSDALLSQLRHLCLLNSVIPDLTFLSQTNNLTSLLIGGSTVLNHSIEASPISQQRNQSIKLVEYTFVDSVVRNELKKHLGHSVLFLDLVAEQKDEHSLLSCIQILKHTYINKRKEHLQNVLSYCLKAGDEWNRSPLHYVCFGNFSFLHSKYTFRGPFFLVIEINKYCLLFFCRHV